MLRASNRPLLAYFDAIKNLRLRQLNLILKAGFDPNLMVNARGQNGLQFMVNLFNATEAHFRLQAPINKAAYLGIAKLLLDSGLDVNQPDLVTGETVVYEAIRLNDRELVGLLLHYADFTHRNKVGETILMCAARFGSKQTMRAILDHLRTLDMDGYFLRQRNRFGLTALELARAENLETAKVLTKHVIAYGHHAGAVLSRSSSHHQLRALQSYQQQLRGPPAVAAIGGPKPGLFLNNHDDDDDSPSDFSECEVLPPRGTLNRALLTGYKTPAGIYDPKAAEFNQYLLEQQQELAGEPQPTAGFNGSDEEDYFGMAAGGSGGGLTRSRSCMLGPSAGAAGGGKNFKYPKGKGAGKAGEPAAGTSGAAGKQSWEPSSGGGGGARNPQMG